MKRLNNILKYHQLPLLFIAMLSSCNFETVVKVNLPEENPKLVVNSVIIPDSVITVNLTLSKHILDDVDYSFNHVNDALVSITDSEGNNMILPYHEDSKLYYNPGFKAKQNIEYSIRASHLRHVAVEAFTVVRRNVPIIKVEKGGIANSSQNSPSTIFYVSFQDPPDETNFYRIRVSKDLNQSGDILFPVYISSSDPAFASEYESRYLLFKDNLISGREIKIPVMISDYELNSTQTLSFFLDSFHEDLFKYTETKALQQFVDGDPFAQPVLVFTNINNGFGIFSSYSPSLVTLKL